jgi:lipoyl(octanoyl) transferase
VKTLTLIDTGLKKYAEVLALQEEYFNANLQAKEANQPTYNHLILCEHEPVFTLGKSGKRENILVSDTDMNAEFYQTNRGGDVTFHGPGQLVVYPVLDLETLGIGLAQYISMLEDVIIESCKAYNIKAERLEGAPGIWVIPTDTAPRKICAIGVKASRLVTMHGLAMNVNTDLTYFDKIIPCGLEGKGVTSLQKELGTPQSMGDYKKEFVKCFEKIFGVSIS